MSEPRLSPATKALLRAARWDAPSAAARAKVWSGVSGTVGGAAGAAGAAGGSAAAAGAAFAGGTSVTKMLAMGTLLGGTVTVGLATLLLGIGPAPSAPPARAAMPLSVAAAPSRPVVPVNVLPERDVFLVASADAPSATRPSVLPRLPAASPRPLAPVHGSSGQGTLEADRLLTQEAALVTEARDALLRGDGHAALHAVRAARALPSHRLAPEELSVEAQALRALGREDDARDTDSTLRKQFPESALAR